MIHLLRLFLIGLVYLFLGSASIGAQEVSLLFFGDVMGHGGQIESAKRDGGARYDYSESFQYVEPYFRASDIVVGNLEVTLAGPPYSGYPRFSSPDGLAHSLREAGVNVLVTANNHSVDKGKAGLERTLRVLDDNYFVRTGTFYDSTDVRANHPQLITIHGIRLALLNYSYGTNGLPVTLPNQVNLINRELMALDLKTALEMEADKVIVFIHWGNEYQTTPSKGQTDLAEFLFEAGADIIIGAHPHVIQPMHFTVNDDGKEQLVVYSLGNFVSNQRKPYTDGGAMVRLVLTKREGQTHINNVEHLLTWVHVPVIAGRRRYHILPASIYDKTGVPEFVPSGWEGMKEYLRLAREVMKGNINVPETTEEWPL
jgi:hypothetical protein